MDHTITQPIAVPASADELSASPTTPWWQTPEATDFLAAVRRSGAVLAFSAGFIGMLLLARAVTGTGASDFRFSLTEPNPAPNVAVGVEGPSVAPVVPEFPNPRAN